MSHPLRERNLWVLPPMVKQLRGKVSIAILFSRSQLGAGRLENADLNL